MARISFAAHPFLLGFEQIDRLLEKTIKSSNDGFPPYNIELSDDNNYKIIAVGDLLPLFLSQTF